MRPGDQRSLFHAEVDGIVVHDEPVAPVPAEVAAAAAALAPVLHFRCHVEERVKRVEMLSAPAEIVGGAEKLDDAQLAIARFGLFHRPLERTVRQPRVVDRRRRRAQGENEPGTSQEPNHNLLFHHHHPTSFVSSGTHAPVAVSSSLVSMRAGARPVSAASACA